VSRFDTRRGLSAREVQVLSLLADGLSTREVAGVLFLSASTVRTHVENILAALGARNRTQAAVLAVRGGLLPTETAVSP
jgi:DNA-binding NarL/FixJ family response regulator